MAARSVSSAKLTATLVATRKALASTQSLLSSSTLPQTA